MTETTFYSDDCQLIYDLLQKDWNLDDDVKPTMSYQPEAYMMNARAGAIYIYPVSRQQTVSSTDYRTLQRTTMLGIKLSTRTRERQFSWGQEIYRILMANRRAGQDGLKGYSYIEVLNDRQSTDLSGWYSTTFDVKLITYVLPIVSGGFGSES
jgi:hypothetical protein